MFRRTVINRSFKKNISAQLIVYLREYKRRTVENMNTDMFKFLA